jgi:hypothetical protein
LLLYFLNLFFVLYKAEKYNTQISIELWDTKSQCMPK